MTAPVHQGTEQPSFERFALGWRIPPAILEPLLHPAAPVLQREVAPDALSAAPEPDAADNA
jgi:hypothetical protein